MRQTQGQKRKVWSCAKTIDKFPEQPKHQDNCQLFGAYIAAHEWAFTKIMKRKDFIEFNTKNNIRDANGNVKNGMNGHFYTEVFNHWFS